MSSGTNTIITSAHIQLPPSKIIPWLQHPPNILGLNPLGVSHAKISTEPLIYSIRFDIPVLFGLFKLPVKTEAVFSIKEDGIFVTTSTYGVKTSSEWRVIKSPDTRSACVVREDFKLVKGWWGFGWFIMTTARKEHIDLMGKVVQVLKEEFRLDHDSE